MKISKKPRSENQILSIFTSHSAIMISNMIEKYKLYTDLVNGTAFISERTPFEQIKNNFVKLQTLEENLKQEIRFSSSKSITDFRAQRERCERFKRLY